MTLFPNGESLGYGEPEPDPLGLGFSLSDVGDGGSLWLLGVPNRPLTVRSAVRRTNGSTTGDPSPPSVAGTLEAFYCWLMPDVHHFDPTAVNGVMPSGDLVKRPRSIVVLGV
jgi:hypothetical protein